MVLEQLMPVHFHQGLNKLLNITSSARLNTPSLCLPLYNRTVSLPSSVIVSYIEKKSHLLKRKVG